MKSIIPIIGHEVGVGSSLKKRIELLLSEKGFAANLTDDASIIEILESSVLEISLPVTIVIYQGDLWDEHSDIVMPILKKFPATHLLLCKPDTVAKQIYSLQPEISLWGKNDPPEDIRKAIKYIYTHLDDSEMQVSHICKAVNLAEDTIERKFKNWNNTTVWKHVEYMRLREACRILEETTAPVAEVAICCGYTDLTSFDRAFKHEFKMTPSAYRKNAKFLRKYA